jgi:hypothetical protein
MTYSRFFRHLVGFVLTAVLLLGCSNRPLPAMDETPVLSTITTTPPPTLVGEPTFDSPQESSTPSLVPTVIESGDNGVSGLSEDEIATLSSLEKVDDFPLYTMRYYGPYLSSAGMKTSRQLGWERVDTRPGWGCSLFAALGETDKMLYGRNFDWEYSPALLLYTDPPDGFASVSMVDLAYLFETSAEIQNLSQVSITERVALLDTPAWPFDGVNEKGLAVGMAAVPTDGGVKDDPEKENIYSLLMIREMLDHAANVYEALALIGRYNIVFDGPPLHYLLADSTGRSALVEFFQGERVVIINEQPWQMATNFLCAPEGECNTGKCRRYDTINERLEGTQGRLTTLEAMDLLAEVSQEGTQWSILYGINTGEISAVLGREYEIVHEFFLEK